MSRITKSFVFVVATVAVALLIGFVGSKFGYRSPAFALFLNWMVMSWWAILGGTLKWSLPLSPHYFNIRGWESTGRVYRLLGIGLFKRLLVRGPLAALNPAIRSQGGRRSLSELTEKMCEAEAGHVLIFVVMLLFVFSAALQGWWGSVFWLLLFNMLLNLYPIMLQRYNRARIERILQR